MRLNVSTTCCPAGAAIVLTQSPPVWSAPPDVLDASWMVPDDAVNTDGWFVLHIDTVGTYCHVSAHRPPPLVDDDDDDVVHCTVATLLTRVSALVSMLGDE